jgi:hypothetical protein
MHMNDQELLLQSVGLPPVYVDGFGAFRLVNGILRTVGFIHEGGAQLNLFCSIVGADHAQAETRRVLSEPPTRGFHIWSGTALAH